jgi:hypothetical protein
MRTESGQALTRNLIFTGIVLSGLLTLNTYARQPNQFPISGEPLENSGQLQPCQKVPSGKPMAQTELYFGLSKSDGSVVTDAVFQQFLDQEVTPRFPDGFTLIAGNGQFKNAGGKIIRERSRVLSILYPIEDNTFTAKVEQIRTSYKQVFQQESMLRVDDTTCAAF